MKKLMLVFSLFAFVAIAGANAQCSKSSAACCAKKNGTTSASTTAVGGDEMVKKVANTNETKAACCAKGDAKSCKKEASSCHGGSSKVSDATAPNKLEPKVARQAVNAATPVANEKK